MAATYRFLKLCATAALAGLAASGTWASEHSHGHEHGNGEPAKLTLDHGNKWATDEPLRNGMVRIRDGVQGALPEIREGRMSVVKYKGLATQVNDAVGRIVATCKLEPKADAQLHVLIADILAGVEAMEGQAPGMARDAGAARVIAALHQYAAHFDHPGWKPISY